LQRAVLAAVELLGEPVDAAEPFGESVTLPDLARRLFGESPTVSQMVSLRRAIRTLVDAGRVARAYVVLEREDEDGRYLGRSTVCVVRRPLTESEEAACSAARAARRAWCDAALRGGR
jgi:hypothetical protein